jgi:hypothetical protein
MTWYLNGRGRLETSFKAEINQQRLGLSIGGEKAAEFLDDPRLLELPAAFEDSYEVLPQTINRYHRLMHGWKALLNALAPEVAPHEQVSEDDQQLPLAS